jgi:hypothetical protein
MTTERSASPFMKSNPALDEALSKAKSSSEVQEILAQLVPSRNSAGVFDGTQDADRPSQPSNSPAAVPNGSHMRIFYVHNDRYEIFSDSDAGLDEKERRIRDSVR